MSVAIVTDSTADIPDELAQEKGISVIRNVLIIDGESLEDGIGISRQEFYERQPEFKSSSTATASSGTYQEVYEKLFEQGASQIISIHPSGDLSGVFNAANGAAVMYGDRVHVVDSRSISLGLGFQALAAAEAAARGAPADAILSELDELRPRVRVVAMLDTLEYVRRSGRVSWARAHLGNLLRIKPFVEVKEGLVQSLGEARTRRKGIERLRQRLLDQGPLERLAMVHSNAEAEARQILDDLNVQLPTPPLVVNITTVIGNHIGPGALGFVAVVKG